MSYLQFEKIFTEKMQGVLTKDPAHDILHVKRVVQTAFSLIDESMNVKKDVLFAACWLHDYVNLPKDHPDRKKASVLSADAAITFLKSLNYPTESFEDIHHAICAHSFSAGIPPLSIEAKLLQDADRLDALGAIGLARLFSISTQMQKPFYSEEEPIAQRRTLDDKQFALDHIFIKLNKLPELMNTEKAKKLADQRVEFINLFLKQINSEILCVESFQHL